MTTPTKSALQQLPAGIWVLGFVSMLMDISSEMIHSLLPLFMVTTLGSSALAIGLVEGLAESTALIIKVFSGVLSDYLRILANVNGHSGDREHFLFSRIGLWSFLP